MRKVLALLALCVFAPALMAPTGGIPVTVPQYIITAAETGAGVTPVQWGYTPGNVLRYGRNATPGTTDMATAIQAALNSNAAVKIPNGTYRVSSGITIPSNTVMQSDGLAATSPPNTGAIIICDLAVTPCVTVGGASANNGAVGLIGVTVTRAAGSIPAGSIGVLVQNVYNPTLSYINSVRHAIGFEFSADGIQYGISAQPDHLYTGAITDTHVFMLSWPELRITQSRFGHNGGVDVACASYMRISGGSTSNASAGPNTLYLTNTQFNQGGGATCTNWIQFINQTPSSIANIAEWAFSNVHVEAVGTQYITSDATFTNLSRLRISNCHFTAVVPFFALNAATTVNDWGLSNNYFGAGLTLAPSSQINFLEINNNKFGAAVSITGVGNSSVVTSNNIYTSSLTYAGSFAHLVSLGDSVSGAFADTSAAAYKLISNPSTGLSVNGSKVPRTVWGTISNATGCTVTAATGSSGITACTWTSNVLVAFTISPAYTTIPVCQAIPTNQTVAMDMNNPTTTGASIVSAAANTSPISISCVGT